MTTQHRDQPKFIADCHLGKLAKYLRIMGVDTLFFPQIEDDELIAIAQCMHMDSLTQIEVLLPELRAYARALCDRQENVGSLI